MEEMIKGMFRVLARRNSQLLSLDHRLASERNSLKIVAVPP